VGRHCNRPLLYTRDDDESTNLSSLKRMVTEVRNMWKKEKNNKCWYGNIPFPSLPWAWVWPTKNAYITYKLRRQSDVELRRWHDIMFYGPTSARCQKALSLHTCSRCRPDVLRLTGVWRNKGRQV